MNTRTIERAVIRAGNPRKAILLMRFFKTGPGQYGEGDRFVGLMVPGTRELVRKYSDAPIPVLRRLLDSPIHEVRLLSLLVLVNRFKRGTVDEQRSIFDLYMACTDRINNWDLVDLSAPWIVGGWLSSRSRRPVYRMARSRLLWDRRIAVLASFYWIRDGEFSDALKLARMSLTDRHDLMHKAAGWMLREIGKRDRDVLCAFLDRHALQMPRTMLRYAIERLPASHRRHYMRKET